MGRKLRKKLLQRLESFTNVFGLTLTVDPGLFESPEQAWLYVMDSRCFYHLVRALRRRKHVHSRAYFWVVEFQQRTEFAHWHLLLDATRIPYGEVVEIWSRFRPEWAPPLSEAVTAENYKGRAPAFGSVRFTVRRNKRSAGFYASKYLTKFPAHGYPNWVMDRVGRMPRYHHSRQFFPRTAGHDPKCSCPECRPPERPSRKKTKKKKEKKKNDKAACATGKSNGATIRERVAACATKSTIFAVPQVMLPDGELVDGRVSFVKNVNLAFEEVRQVLGIEASCPRFDLREGDELLLSKRIEEKPS